MNQVTANGLMGDNGLREGLVWVLLLGVVQEHLRWAAVTVLPMGPTICSP